MSAIRAKIIECKNETSMTAVTPFFREQGQGLSVVCLHSNASTSVQWRALSELLADRMRVVAVDSYGAGKSPDWPGQRALQLQDEAELVAAVLPPAPEPFHLVGHSYGAAVALKLALMQPDRVRSMVLYEPTLFSLIADDDPLNSPAEGIWRAASDAADAIDRGDTAAAARRFIDYWMGPGTWAAMPAARQAVVAPSMRPVRSWRDVAMRRDFGPDALATLKLPVLLMWGEQSPASALAVVDVLRRALPQVQAAPQAGLGHMAPITHAAQINPQIAEFIARH